MLAMGRPMGRYCEGQASGTTSWRQAVIVASVAAGGDFSASDNCPRVPATLAPDAACTITVAFTPSSGDVPSSGALTVTDNAPGGAQGWLRAEGAGAYALDA